MQGGSVVHRYVAFNGTFKGMRLICYADNILVVAGADTVTEVENRENVL